MKRLALLVLTGGIVLALTGFVWLWSGLDIVQVERGWSGVIAGATMMSAGFVIIALAGVLAMLRRITDALSSPTPRTEGSAEPRAEIGALTSAPLPGDAIPDQTNGEAGAHADREVVGRHVSGEATYVMFADGSVEAQTPEGVQRFASLEALRAYADEREAATGR